MKLWQRFTEPDVVAGAGIGKLNFHGGVAGKRLGRVKRVDQQSAFKHSPGLLTPPHHTLHSDLKLNSIASTISGTINLATPMLFVAISYYTYFY